MINIPPAHRPATTANDPRRVSVRRIQKPACPEQTGTRTVILRVIATATIMPTGGKIPTSPQTQMGCQANGISLRSAAGPPQNMQTWGSRSREHSYRLRMTRGM